MWCRLSFHFRMTLIDQTLIPSINTYSPGAEDQKHHGLIEHSTKKKELKSADSELKHLNGWPKTTGIQHFLCLVQQDEVLEWFTIRSHANLPRCPTAAVLVQSPRWWVCNQGVFRHSLSVSVPSSLAELVLTRGCEGRSGRCNGGSRVTFDKCD